MLIEGGGAGVPYQNPYKFKGQDKLRLGKAETVLILENLHRLWELSTLQIY